MHQHHILMSSAARLGQSPAAGIANDFGGRMGGRRTFDHRWFTHTPISEYSRRISQHADKSWARVILGGVDTDKFSPDPSIRRSTRALFVGRLLPHKGVGDLIAALPGTAALDIVGPLNTTGSVESLKRQAEGKDITFTRCCDRTR